MYPGLVGDIARYESGDMEEDEVVDLFQRLVDTGIIDHLQGSYHRMASQLAAAGLITVGSRCGN